MTGLARRPDGLDEVFAVVSGLDACLASGLSRLAGDRRDALGAFGYAFVGTPLQEPVSDAVQRISGGEFAAKPMLALAAGRSSLLGAAHDALQTQISAAFALQIPSREAAAPAPPAQPALLASAQQWLSEIAVAGFENLDESQLTPFSATLDQILAEPELTGLGALLSGVVAEWRDSLGQPPAIEAKRQRWADLWMTAYLAAQQGPAVQQFEQVSGSLVPVGVDLRQHGHFVAASFYGVLDGRVVRVPFSSYKVDVVAGDEVWKLFRPSADPFFEALQDRKSVRIEGAELSAGGDLTGGTAKVADKVDVFGLEITQGFPVIEPLRRHPVQIVQMVRLMGCKPEVSDKVVTHIDGFEVAYDRNHGIEELPAEIVAQAQDVIGLIRFDGFWQIQPLAVRGKGKAKDGVLAGEGVLKRCAKLKANALDILSERADKLLRAS